MLTWMPGFRCGRFLYSNTSKMQGECAICHRERTGPILQVGEIDVKDKMATGSLPKFLVVHK